MKKIILIFAGLFILAGCVAYRSPERATWGHILRGASFSGMTNTAKVAKKPIYQGQDGKLITEDQAGLYMSALEVELSDALRKPGIQIQLVGQDVLMLLVRDAFIDLNNPDISADGADSLASVADILKKYDRTFIEIVGYSDAMKDQNAATSFSFDMAERVAVFLVKSGIKPVRLFVSGRGSARPIAAQDDIGRLMNRRVEFRISPVK